MAVEGRATYSIWEGEGITLVPYPGPPVFADGRPQDPTATKVYEFAEDSWEAACQVMHDLYGWGIYEPGGSD